MTRAVLALAFFATTACGDDPDAGHPHGSEATGPEVDAAAYEGCSMADASTPSPELEIGMSALGQAGKIQGVLVDANPNPPMRYRNDWTVKFERAQGGALADVQITDARPFMPVHGHDGNVTPTLTQNTDGTYLIENLNLNMRGPWEIQLHVSSPSAGDDYIVFHVCVLE